MVFILHIIIQAGGLSEEVPADFCLYLVDSQSYFNVVFTFKRLSNLVATAKQSQQFFERMGRMREKVAEENKDKEPIPVFNKRLFAAQGNVVISKEGEINVL